MSFESDIYVNNNIAEREINFHESVADLGIKKSNISYESLDNNELEKYNLTRIAPYLYKINSSNLIFRYKQGLGKYSYNTNMSEDNITYNRDIKFGYISTSFNQNYNYNIICKYFRYKDKFYYIPDNTEQIVKEAKKNIMYFICLPEKYQSIDILKYWINNKEFDLELLSRNCVYFNLKIIKFLVSYCIEKRKNISEILFMKLLFSNLKVEEKNYLINNIKNSLKEFDVLIYDIMYNIGCCPNVLNIMSDNPKFLYSIFDKRSYVIVDCIKNYQNKNLIPLLSKLFRNNNIVLDFGYLVGLYYELYYKSDLTSHIKILINVLVDNCYKEYKNKECEQIDFIISLPEMAKCIANKKIKEMFIYYVFNSKKKNKLINKICTEFKNSPICLKEFKLYNSITNYEQ